MCGWMGCYMYLCCTAVVLLYVVGAGGWLVLLFPSSTGVAAYQEQNTQLCINVYFSSAAAVHAVVLYMMGEWVRGWVGGWVRKHRSHFSTQDSARCTLRMLQDTS